MKRLLALLTALAVSLCALPALAWEVSDEALTLAAELLPEYQVLSACLDDGQWLFLLTDAQAQTLFATCVPKDGSWRVTFSHPLPRDLFWITYGCCFPGTAMLLAEDFYGRTTFCGFALTDGMWRLTRSTPLPKGACRLDTYHAYDGCVTIHLPGGDAAAALQEDGRWLLTWANDVSIGTQHIWFGMGGPYYADVLLERDITLVDWEALPVSYEDWLPVVDASAWAVVTGEPAALRAEDGGVIARYLSATPVRLLERRGAEYRVAIAGGSVTGWMDASALLVGEEQLDLNGEEGFTVREDGFIWGVNSVIVGEDAMLHDAPGGNPVQEASMRADVLTVREDGWLHVMDSGCGEYGFLRAEDCADFQQWLEELQKTYNLQ